VDFLIALLDAHAETLKRLAALFEEENLVQLLEMAGENEENSESSSSSQWTDPRLFEAATQVSSMDSTYAELEGAIREMNLPATLEFHLWAYPHYRAFIESPLNLNSKIPGPGGDTGVALVEEAVAQAEVWFQKLPMGDAVREQASRAARVPWIRFRTQVLKKIGKRPMGPVY
jgi:hypothetical protein